MSPARPARRPRRIGGSELGRRLVVALPAVAYAVFIVAAGGWAFAAGILLLGWVCLHELFRMYETARPVKLAGFIALAGLTAAALWGSERQVLLALAASVPLVFVIGTAMPRPDGVTFTGAMAITLLAIVWVGLAIAHTVLLEQTPHGGGIVIDILVGTFLGDTFAYLGGRWFGTRALAPRISPSKTLEGLAIGFAAAVLFTWAAGLYQDWLSGWDALVLGVAVGVSAPLGDLLESAIKRDAKIKDAGTLFGAHGGALDRLDAAFFSLVTGYYVWLALL